MLRLWLCYVTGHEWSVAQKGLKPYMNELRIYKGNYEKQCVSGYHRNYFVALPPLLGHHIYTYIHTYIHT